MRSLFLPQASVTALEGASPQAVAAAKVFPVDSVLSAAQAEWPGHIGGKGSGGGGRRRGVAKPPAARRRAALRADEVELLADATYESAWNSALRKLVSRKPKLAKQLRQPCTEGIRERVREPECRPVVALADRLLAAAAEANAGAAPFVVRRAIHLPRSRTQHAHAHDHPVAGRKPAVAVGGSGGSLGGGGRPQRKVRGPL